MVSKAHETVAGKVLYTHTVAHSADSSHVFFYRVKKPIQN